ncbi:hypothetical protein CDD83_8 [Cordyceps sp. RAO-2017]|nr:hypothetical protein CDD83_8 [Cordyceps sp. RAO-2017]
MEEGRNGQVNGRANERANVQANVQANEPANGRANVQANGQANGQVNGRANGQANGRANDQANGRADSQASGQENDPGPAPANNPAGGRQVTSLVPYIGDRHEALRRLIRSGAVLTIGDDDFIISLRRWSLTAVRIAGVVVQPGDAIEVSMALQYARHRRMQVAVVSGGHSTGGASSTMGGLVIDLRRLNRVVVFENRVTFGAGCRWHDVDEACAGRGVATVGPTVNSVGVGGSALGGGFGWLTGRSSSPPKPRTGTSSGPSAAPAYTLAYVTPPPPFPPLPAT